MLSVSVWRVSRGFIFRCLVANAKKIFHSFAICFPCLILFTPAHDPAVPCFQALSPVFYNVRCDSPLTPPSARSTHRVCLDRRVLTRAIVIHVIIIRVPLMRFVCPAATRYHRQPLTFLLAVELELELNRSNIITYLHI